MNRLLALDVGEKRIGVAVSDEMHVLARPVGAIARASFERDVEALGRVLAQYQVETIIAGYPRSLSGEEGPQALRVRHYVERLAAALPVKVIFWDEQFSTVEATERLIAAKRRRRAERGDKGQIDAAAAAVILQDYLDSKRGVD